MMRTSKILCWSSTVTASCHHSIRGSSVRVGSLVRRIGKLILSFVQTSVSRFPPVSFVKERFVASMRYSLIGPTLSLVSLFAKVPPPCRPFLSPPAIPQKRCVVSDMGDIPFIYASLKGPFFPPPGATTVGPSCFFVMAGLKSISQHCFILFCEGPCFYCSSFWFLERFARKWRFPPLLTILFS